MQGLATSLAGPVFYFPRDREAYIVEPKINAIAIVTRIGIAA